MVGLVIVSHSAALAAGVVELARQMAGDAVAIEAAGGMGDDGGIGTDVALVSAAIDRAAGPDGVLVLMDLGSALMSAEMAVEMAGDAVRVVLSEAPLVEGAVAAAALAGAGASLDEVAAEARTALTAKTAQLAPAGGGGAERGSGAGGLDRGGRDAGPSARLPVAIPLGLHARPAARVVEAVGRFAAQVTVADETTGRGPVDARSLSALLTLGARHGHTLLARATGPDAAAALAALEALAAEGFGDEPTPAAPAPAAPSPSARGDDGARAPSPPPAGATLRGLAVVPGVAIGPARPLVQPAARPSADAGEPAEEERRLAAALQAARKEVAAARDLVAGRTSGGEAAILDAHLLLLADTALLARARGDIAAGHGAAMAWDAAVRAVADDLRAVDDPYLRERAADLDDVGTRVLAHLTGAPTTATPTEPGILVAADLAPGQVAALDRDTTTGIALARGGATSHAAILARALGIPTTAGLGDALLAIPPGTTLVLDGAHGTVEVDPDPTTLAAREEARRTAAARHERARAAAHAPATTRDGATLTVAANLGAIAGAAQAVRLGADGVGLLRTEFLYLGRDAAPTEEEQRAALEEIATALDGRSLVVRTLDAGADKPLPYLRQPHEDNPFLGVRGLRLGLQRPDILRTQLRAILATAARHPLQVMFPMVATLAELRDARGMVEEVRAELGAPEIQVGVMVEVPALALQAGRFAAEADFLSVGTNDLTQYTMAAERGNDAVGALLGGVQPAVLKLIAAVTEAAAAHGRWVGVCGELAGDPAAAVLLAGLGVEELSVAPPLVPDVKDALRHTSLADAQELARRALDLDDAAAVADLLARGAVAA